jgi:ribosomal protein S18 acetylase RimI-like enzyme
MSRHGDFDWYQGYLRRTRGTAMASLPPIDIDRRGSGPAHELEWHRGPRADLRHLFELAEDSPQQLDGYLHLGRVLVALEDGSPIGHLQIIESDPLVEVELKTMAVAERLQGRGIGRALIERALVESRAAGAQTMLVSTASADVGALRFYQRLGFRMLRIERDAFTAAEGYPEGLTIDGIPLRDRVWLSQRLH